MKSMRELIGKCVIDAGSFYTENGESFFRLTFSDETILVFAGERKSVFNNKANCICYDMTEAEKISNQQQEKKQ